MRWCRCDFLKGSVFAFVLFACALTGCGKSSDTFVCQSCAVDSDCLGGQSCRQAICVAPGQDPRRCPGATGDGSSSGSGSSTTGGASTGSSSGTTSSTSGSTGGTTGSVVPRIIASAATAAAGYSGYTPQDLTLPAETQVGDLVIIAMYVEPAKEGSPAATYGDFTVPSGVNLLAGFPINTDDSQIATGDDHRLYVYSWYASEAGATVLHFTNSVDIYWGLAAVVIRGAPVTDRVVADPAATATISRSATDVTSTPPVSLNLQGPNSLVLWIYGDWGGDNPGSPVGFNNVTHALNQGGQPAIASAVFSSAGNTGTIAAARASADDGMTAALLSFRVR